MTAGESMSAAREHDALLKEAEEATHPLRSIRGWDNEALGTLVGKLARALRGVSSLRAPQSGPWTIEQQGTRAARTVTNGRYRYTFFGDDAPENAAAVCIALNAVAGAGAETPPQPEIEK